MWSSPLPCYIIPCRSRYSPQHPILKHPHPTFIPLCEEPSSTPIQNSSQNYSSVYFNLYILSSKLGKEKKKKKSFCTGPSSGTPTHYLERFCTRPSSGTPTHYLERFCTGPSSGTPTHYLERFCTGPSSGTPTHYLERKSHGSKKSQQNIILSMLTIFLTTWVCVAPCVHSCRTRSKFRIS